MDSTKHPAISKTRQLIGVTFLGLIFALAIYANFADDSKPTRAPLKIVNVTWDDLTAQLNENKLSFDDQYKDVRLKLSASVLSVFDAYPGPHVMMLSGSGQTFLSVFFNNQAAKLKSLHTGDHLTFICLNMDAASQLNGCKVDSIAPNPRAAAEGQ